MLVVEATEFNSEAILDLGGHLEGVATGETVILNRDQMDIGTVLLCGMQVNGSYRIVLSTADIEGHCPLDYHLS